MNRTQIYLPTTQLKQLRKQAMQKQNTVSDVIRAFIQQGLKNPKLPARARNSFKSIFTTMKEIRAFKEYGPKDLAQNLDAYLYGN